MHISDLLRDLVVRPADEAVELVERHPGLRTREAYDTLASWLPLNDHDPEVRAAIVDRLELIRSRAEEPIEQSASVLDSDEGEASPEWIAAARRQAVAYAQRTSGDLMFNQERAIELLTRVVAAGDADRGRWAEAQSNLGNVYAIRLRGDAIDNLARAVEAYDRALAVFDRDEQPVRWARTAINRANCLHDRSQTVAEGAEPDSDLLEAAIAGYLEVLEALQPESAPEEWATASENLANALDDRRRPGDAARALDLLAAAHRVHDRRRAPWVWARIHNTRGVVLAADGRDDEALAAFLAALEVYTPDLAPESHRRVARNAGDLHFRRGRWSEAWHHYASCLWAAASLAREGHTAEARQRQRMEEMDVPGRAAYCLARLGRGERAVEVLERAKARLLAETFSPPAIGTDPEADPAADPRAPAADWAAIQRAVPAGVAVVHLVTTEHGSVALVTGSSAHDGPQVAFVDDFVEADLDSMLDAAGGGLIAAVGGREGADLERVLAEAWPLLSRWVGSVESRLRVAAGTGISWVAVGKLTLLPLSAACERVAGRLPAARWLDRRVGDRGGDRPRLLAVGWPGEGARRLPAVGREIERVAERFAEERRTVLVGGDATLAAVRDALPRADVLHVAGHGLFDPSEPLDTAIQLAGGGSLTLRQILDGELDVSGLRLAVLSACETGLAEYRYLADEALGFSAALLFAGVSTVVASLWPVDDLAATLLLSRFYAHLVGDGWRPGRALASARTWLRESTADQLELASLCEEILRRPLPSKAEAAAVYRRLRHARRNPDGRPFAAPVHWSGYVVSGAL